MAEVLEYEMRGKDTSFGSTVKDAVAAVNQLKGAGAAVLSSFTGGLIGGGISQSIIAAVSLIRDLIREARQLAVEAERLGRSVPTTRGVKNLETALNLPAGTIPSAAGAVENAVQEALQGSSSMKRQFEVLGLTPKALNGVDKLEQLFRVLEAFGTAGAGPEQRFAARQIIGGGTDALEPYAIGGKSRLNFRDTVAQLRLLSDNATLRSLEGNSAYVAAISPETRAAFQQFQSLRDVKGRQGLRAELPGYSAFGLENAERVRRMNESAAEMEARNARSLLTADQQRLAITEQRLKLQRQMESETDPLRRAQLRGDIAQLAGESLAISAREIRSGMKPVSNDMDQLGRAGFFRGAAPDVSTELMRKQLTEMTKILETLRHQPAAIAREL